MTKQSDIARQFQLPERQSKLATMLREEGLRDEQVYCTCRSSDVSRFMIGCDRCEEWYHGDCINVTENEAGKIRKFYCIRCRTKHPGLQIKYKPSKSDHHHHHSRHHENDKQKDKMHNRHDKHLSTPRSGVGGGVSGGKSGKRRRRDRCGECEACYVKEDCGRCEPCKYGGTDGLRQRCKKRQCHNFYHLAKKLKSSPSKHIKHSRTDHSYNSISSEPKLMNTSVNLRLLSEYANNCTSTTGIKNEDTEDIIRSITAPSGRIRSISPAEIKREETPSPIPPTPSSPLFVKPQPQIRPQLITKPHQTEGYLKKESFGVLGNKNNSDDDELWKPSVQKVWDLKPKSRKRKETNAQRKRKPRRDSSSESDSQNWVGEKQNPKQCFGPGCVKPARPNSKYCREECGLRLAESRIYSVLPQRIQEWKMSVCEAEEKDRKLLEKIRRQQLEARRALQQLDQKHKELDVVVEAGKSSSIDPRADEEGDEEGSGEGAAVYCVACGHEIPTRRAIKHMHSCYNKLESQMSFGSMYKTRIEGGNNMFCDFFSPNNHTYCKRLRVMCPEHTKEAKVSNTEVCGFPLTTDIFTETGNVCRVSKKKCLRHYSWDKLRRANIDMERVRQCLILDELVEQERQVRVAITNRAGVLGLMLHSTYDHQLAEKRKKHQYQQPDNPYHQSDHQYHQKETGADTQYSEQLATRIDSPYRSDHHYHRQENQPKMKYPHKMVVPVGAKIVTNLGTKIVTNLGTKSAIGANLGSKSGTGTNFGTKSGTGISAVNMKIGTPSLGGPAQPRFGQSDSQKYHDHQYSSSPHDPPSKRPHDHLYYSDRKK